ncbi:MAG: histidine phosphatase family protein [Acidobacteria bacterium]|nr:MAG: histidine phosphatase family protein [Acidobacteriota bacterium]
MLHLMIMRHGKSDWDADASDDRQRPLSARGIASSERMGKVIRDMGLVPDVVIASDAVRARATAELARISGGWACRLVLEPDLYGASVDEAIDVISNVSDVSERIMVVGHEPTWSMLVKRLTGATVAMKTAAVADIEFPCSQWTRMPSVNGTLVALLQARHFVQHT